MSASSSRAHKLTMLGYPGTEYEFRIMEQIGGGAHAKTHRAIREINSDHFAIKEHDAVKKSLGFLQTSQGVCSNDAVKILRNGSTLELKTLLAWDTYLAMFLVSKHARLLLVLILTRWVQAEE
ncbi:hypothetical protein Peur_014993 [Populus x canadensis]